MALAGAVKRLNNGTLFHPDQRKLALAQQGDRELNEMILFLKAVEGDKELPRNGSKDYRGVLKGSPLGQYKPKVLNLMRAKTSDYALEGADKLLVHYMWDTRLGSHRRQIVVPRKYRTAVLTIYHSSLWGHHNGEKALYGRITEGYHWPGLSECVLWWVKNCMECKKAKQVEKRRAGTLQPIPIAPRFNKVSADLMGELPETKMGNKYITRHKVQIPGLCKAIYDIVPFFNLCSGHKPVKNRTPENVKH